MGRRKGHKLPQMRRHAPSGNARVRLAGKEYWLGQFGSPEARVRYDDLVAAYIASGRTSIEAAAKPAEPQAPATPAASLTVGELSLRWLNHIEETRPNYRRTSLWSGALAATRALRPFATMAVDDFGSKALLRVQRMLVEAKIEPKQKADPDGPPPKPIRRSRRSINDTIGRIRQLFNWGVLEELVPDDRVKALSIVPPLTYRSSKARETTKRRPVRPSIVRATLPHLTSELADMVWFMRLTGCRPSEVARMRLVDIRDRDKSVWRYTPRRHKTAHHGKQRHIPIGPKAQAIVEAHTVGREPTDYVFTPKRSRRQRVDKATGKLVSWKLSSRVGDKFTKDAIRRAVARAIDKANEIAEKEGRDPLPHWFPYQLRYTRLREIRRRGGREAARAVAGHSTATMTDHYAPPNWGKAAKAALKTG